MANYDMWQGYREGVAVQCARCGLRLSLACVVLHQATFALASHFGDVAPANSLSGASQG